MSFYFGSKTLFFFSLDLLLITIIKSLEVLFFSFIQFLSLLFHDLLFVNRGEKFLKNTSGFLSTNSYY